MNNSGTGAAAEESWIYRRWRSMRSMFNYEAQHERLPIEDEDEEEEEETERAVSPQAGPSTPTPRVPPCSPVSPPAASNLASGYTSDNIDDSETAALVGPAQELSVGSSGSLPDDDGLPRVSSFQRLKRALSALVQNQVGSSSEDEEAGADKASRSSGSVCRTCSRGAFSRTGSGLPTCLICLEPLTPEDFENGEAMSLACECKGDMALRHRACALKWVNVKGDLICDICRAPITNLPAPPPRSENGDEGMEEVTSGRFPGATDVFDCIRMTWVITIVCILFFELNITRALFTGMVVAVLYTFSCQIMRCVYTRSDDSGGRVPAVINTANVGPIVV